MNKTGLPARRSEPAISHSSPDRLDLFHGPRLRCWRQLAAAERMTELRRLSGRAHEPLRKMARPKYSRSSSGALTPDLKRLIRILANALACSLSRERRLLLSSASRILYKRSRSSGPSPPSYFPGMALPPFGLWRPNTLPLIGAQVESQPIAISLTLVSRIAPATPSASLDYHAAAAIRSDQNRRQPSALQGCVQVTQYPREGPLLQKDR